MGGRSATWSATCSAWALRVGIYQYESQIAISWGIDLPLWSAWALRVGIYQYESQIAIFWGGRSGTWSARALRVGIYQYECQFSISWDGIDLPLDLPELWEWQCIWISNCHLVRWTRSATWSASALRVGIHQYESQIAIFLGGVYLALDLPPGLPELWE